MRRNLAAPHTRERGSGTARKAPARRRENGKRGCPIRRLRRYPARKANPLCGEPDPGGPFPPAISTDLDERPRPGPSRARERPARPPAEHFGASSAVLPPLEGPSRKCQSVVRSRNPPRSAWSKPKARKRSRRRRGSRSRRTFRRRRNGFSRRPKPNGSASASASPIRVCSRISIGRLSRHTVRRGERSPRSKRSKRNSASSRETPSRGSRRRLQAEISFITRLRRPLRRRGRKW